MFQYERPNIPAVSPETAPLYNYLYRFVEYCNVMLNHIAPDQIDSRVRFVHEIMGDSESATAVPVDGASVTTKIRVQKVSGIVFLRIGGMKDVPSGDSIMTTLPAEYRPAQDEVYDYTTPDGEAFRFTVKSSGTVAVHSYSSSTLSTVDSQVRMVYPAANI